MIINIVTILIPIVAFIIIIFIMLDNAQEGADKKKASAITRAYGYKESQSFIEIALFISIFALFFLTVTLNALSVNQIKTIEKIQEL